MQIGVSNDASMFRRYGVIAKERISKYLTLKTKVNYNDDLVENWLGAAL